MARKVVEFLSFLCFFLILFSVSKKNTLAVFTVDTINNNSYNPATTPSFKGSGMANVISGAATPDANITMTATGGPTGTIKKTGFGFPTSRWSISLDDLYNANYNVEVESENTKIKFTLVIDDHPYQSQITSSPTFIPSNKDTENVGKNYVTGDTKSTLLFLFGGILLVLVPVFLFSKQGRLKR